MMGDLGADREALRAALEAAGLPPEVRAESLPGDELRGWVLGPHWPAGAEAVEPDDSDLED
ncbi:MAG: hypothetical protein R3F17_00830 [Planctomycetota bacterium]